MRKLLMLTTLSAFAALAGVLLLEPRPLSGSEAERTVGGVMLDSFNCQTVATCNTFNYPFDPPCPKSLPCRTCNFASRNITQCVQKSGAICDWRGANRTDCGRERIGTCLGTTFCANLIWYGTFCNDGPLCRS